MLTINYPAFGRAINVLTAFYNAMDVANRSTKTTAGVLLKSTPAVVFYCWLLLFT